MAQNVFEDLGFPKEEARELKRKSKAVRALRLHIEEQGLSQSEVSAITGLTQCDVSHLVNGKIDRFSIERLMKIAESFDAEVTLEFHFPRRHATGGH